MKKAEKLKEILALLDKDTVTTEEFADQIKTIITHIKNLDRFIWSYILYTDTFCCHYQPSQTPVMLQGQEFTLMK